MRKKLLESAPWRVEEKPEVFEEAKLRLTNQSGTSPGRRSVSPKLPHQKVDSASELDSELRYSFHRNIQFLRHVFSIDTIVKPLPPALAYNVSRSLSFFTHIFTQFFDPEGITNAQKSLGLGQEEKLRHVRWHNDGH